MQILEHLTIAELRSQKSECRGGVSPSRIAVDISCYNTKRHGRRNAAPTIIICYISVIGGTPWAVRVSGGHLCLRQKHRPNRQVRTFPTYYNSADNTGAQNAPLRSLQQIKEPPFIEQGLCFITDTAILPGTSSLFQPLPLLSFPCP